MRIQNILIIGTLVLQTACGSKKDPQQVATSFDLGAVKNHITEMNKTYGDRFVKNDTAFYTDRYCKDAAAMPERMPALQGRTAIQEYYYSNGENKDFKIEIIAGDIYGSASEVI
jgi:hypothetical protein